jgi:hypothetical protein
MTTPVVLEPGRYPSGDTKELILPTLHARPSRDMTKTDAAPTNLGSKARVGPRRFRPKALALLAAVTMSVGLSAPAHAVADLTIGASGDYQTLQSRSSSSLAVHRYGSLDGPAIADVAFVNIEPDVLWSSIANGDHDADLKRWASALKGTGTRLVSFSHEPMTKQNHWMGTSKTFIAAFKHVVTLFDAQGATNVKWVWNVTSYSFRIASSDPNYGAKWYPGNGYVDYVAGEAYNKYRCGVTTPNSFANRIKEILGFAKSHHKKMVVGEFGSNPYAGRADWIRAATSYMDKHRVDFRGAFYWNTNRSPCSYELTTKAEYKALGDMVRTL